MVRDEKKNKISAIMEVVDVGNRLLMDIEKKAYISHKQTTRYGKIR
mgnify:CR=1 FL=1